MIAEKLEMYRRHKGLTQEQLAELLDVSRQTITKWESGNVIPTLDYLIKLSDIFKITIDDLVKDSDCTKNSPLIKEDNNNWKEFLLKAKKETYAKKQGKVASSRPSSHDYQYQEGDYLYIDSFIGSEYFGGEECVYNQGLPLYVMNYYGKVLDNAFNGDFLKEALLLVDHNYFFRGPALYINGKYTYHCSYEGDFNLFSGKEEIYYDSMKVYVCLFHGGLVK